MPVNPLGRTIAVVDDEGRPTQELSLFTEEAARLSPLFGTGSPEGVVQARRGRFYIDTDGSVGSVLYVKVLNDIAGERKEGWVLV